MMMMMMLLKVLLVLSSGACFSWATDSDSFREVTVYITPEAIDGPANTTSCDPAASVVSPMSSQCTLRSAVAYCLVILNATEDLCTILLPPLSTVEIDPAQGEILLSAHSETAAGTLCILGNSTSLVQPIFSSMNANRLFSYVGSSSSGFVKSGQTLNFIFRNFSIAHFGNRTTLGGAISMENYNSGSEVDDGFTLFDTMTFRNNSGFIGGAVKINAGSNIEFISSSFIGNNATREGGGVYLEADNSFINVSSCTFVENVARGLLEEHGSAVVDSSGGLGGGVCIEQRNRNIRIQDSIFFGNEGLRGGAVGLYQDNVGIVFERSLFLRNRGHRGGGVTWAVATTT
jgi:hypothetical protein